VADRQNRRKLSWQLTSVSVQIQTRVAVAFLVLQPVIFFWRALILKQVHIPYDLEGFHLPLASFIARCAREHVSPLWDPFSYCGVPLVGDIQAQLFYPFTWITILMANVGDGHKLFYWLEWLVAVHMMMGAIFTFLLLRKLRCLVPVALLGASIYELGAFFASQTQHLGAVCSGAWFPLTLLCVFELSERFSARWLAALGVSVGLSFLSGFPATTIVVLLLTGFLCLALAWTKLANWRLLGAYGAGCVLGAGLAAVQLVPTFQLSRLSIASIRYLWKTNGGGLPLQSLASFVRPNYYHIFSAFDHTLYTLPYNFTMMYTFCGYAAVVLVAGSLLLLRKSKVLAICFGLLLFSALWMLGESTPIYPVIFHRLPHFLQGSLYAEDALLGFTMFVAIISALAVAHFQQRIAPLLLWLLALGTAANLIEVGANRVMNTADGGYKVAAADSPGNWLGATPREIRKWLNVSTPPLRTDLMQQDTGWLRYGAEVYRLPTAGGDNPFMLLRYYRFRLTYSGDVWWSRQQFLRSFDTKWIDALNIGYLLESSSAPKRPLPANGQLQFVPLAGVNVYRNANPLPRFYTVDKVQRAKNNEASLKAIADKTFNPAEEAVVEGLNPDWESTGHGKATVQVLQYTNTRIELLVNSPGRRFLVSSEPYYPGWTASANGRAATILPANHAFRGLPLEAGQSRIVMSYWPDTLTIGILIEILALIAAGYLLMGNTSRENSRHGIA
jgi:hypothetical protein